MAIVGSSSVAIATIAKVAAIGRPIRGSVAMTLASIMARRCRVALVVAWSAIVIPLSVDLGLDLDSLAGKDHHGSDDRRFEEHILIL